MIEQKSFENIELALCEFWRWIFAMYSVNIFEKFNSISSVCIRCGVWFVCIGKISEVKIVQGEWCLVDSDQKFFFLFLYQETLVYMGYFFEQICNYVMAKLYLSSCRIALWMNDKRKNRNFSSKISSYWIIFFAVLRLMCNFYYALLVESIYRVLLVFEGMNCLFYVYLYNFDRFLVYFCLQANFEDFQFLVL